MSQIVRLVVVASGVVLGACVAETGKVAATVGCGGAVCGETGELVTRVSDCGSNVGEYGETTLGAVTLTTSGIATGSVDYVPEGTRCVEARLILGTGGQVAVSSLGESVVEVVEDETAQAEVTLDQIVNEQAATDDDDGGDDDDDGVDTGVEWDARGDLGDARGSLE